jgi:tricorn protease
VRRPYFPLVPTLLALVLAAGISSAAGASVAADATSPAAAAGDDHAAPLLLRQPTLSRTSIAFAYGGDLWIVGREGGEARRLTTSPGNESHPVFSPDGSEIAFSGEYDGNADVFVMPAEGGSPRRLTWHPSADVPVAWSPDGSQILFRSSRASFSYFYRLFTVPAGGGFPAEVPLPMGDHGAYSPDGSHLAYVPVSQWQPEWKRYRGGQTTPIWIADLADSSVVEVPRANSNDKNPMWVGDTIYFLSDRGAGGAGGAVSLWAYDTAARTVGEALPNDGFDFKSASAGPDGAIVLERFGGLVLFDPASGQAHDVAVTLAGDLPAVRPHFEHLKPDQVEVARISPTGARAVVQARGEILTVPAEKGDVRNLTRTVGAAERDPAWSPDGSRIAFFSDASGEYALHVVDQSGLGEVKTVDLGDPPSFFYAPRWSPDSKKIAYTDKRLNLWVVDVDKGGPVKVATDLYEAPERHLDPAWSPDSRWLAYTRQLPSHYHAVFAYELAGGATHQLTDGLSDALFPAFDAGGKYLYFTASTDVGLTVSWLDMSSIARPVTRSVYVAVLRKGLPSPLAPESDEEKGAAAKDDKDKDKGDAKADAGKDAKKGKKNGDEKKGDEEKAEKKTPPEVTIDFDGLDQRILALPVEAANYVGLAAGKEGEVFLLSAPPVRVANDDAPPTATLQKFTLDKRKSEKLADGVSDFDLSADGEKMLVRQGDSFVIAKTSEPLEAGKGALPMDGLEVRVDPRAEWAQMYHEVWRIERDFFYDPHYVGLDLAAAEARYRPFLARVGSRDDLNALFAEMTGLLETGHTFIRGGDTPDVPKVATGLLGADYAVEQGRYRFARVFNGENWNPDLHAPLTQPGVDVAAGDYLLSVDGRDVRPPASVYSFFEEKAGKQVVLEVGADPSGKGSRKVTVVPVPSEAGLRHLAWIEANRRKVDELSGGKAAYVYLPNTAEGGYTEFNRYYFAQVGKQAAVLDERFNTGGDIADYIIDVLRRPPMSLFATREGHDVEEPISAIFGPKVMVINQYAGSGGDAMPWYFRKAGLGELVGERTWGGLVGIYDYPSLLDGGGVTAPRVALYGLNGEWEVENHGIAPDVEVRLDPAAWRQGHDPQLEKAVAVAMEELAAHPVPQFARPPYSEHYKEGAP